MSSLEIAQAAVMRPIADVAADYGILPDELELYGPVKAKVTLEAIRRLEGERPRGKYVLVTAITNDALILSNGSVISLGQDLEKRVARSSTCRPSASRAC